ncbi:25214_t:CDS:10 [Racocetra persica]|uniref:25214_t:CDS:1 n=1 Tax=Racocetra persica TaxID=160502 RepID=A0ACA9KX74_9GLOM|nr:25214_t:CDS:10 [Racocetra persica]
MYEQYSTKKIKHQVKEITIDEENSLKDVDGGELDLSDYPNLEIIIIDGHCLKSPLTKLELGQKRFLKGLYCSRNQLTNLDLSGCPILEEIHCGKNKLTKLEVNYCTKLQELVCKDNQLAELNLRNCLQLEVLRCGFNQITELDLTSLKHLEQVECNDNFLTKFDYSSLTPEKLTYLNISDNNLPEQDLSVFSNLVNLENLLIGGDNKEHFSKGIYNQFTDIDSGLEYLPDSVEKICFLVEERAESKVKQLVDQLSSLNFELTDKNRGEYSRRGVSKNAQEWLDRKCPSEKRVKFKELDIGNSNLVGPLSLQSFTNLKELYCSNNKITNLDLNDCPNLTTLFCYRNLITEINFSPLNFEKLKKLSSLKPLKVLNKLEELDISNTEITEGLENLPKSIKAINCSNKERPESKVKKIAKQLDEDNSFTCADEDKNYSQEERNKITELDISKNITLNNLPKLRSLDISECEVTNLDIANCPNIRGLFLIDNLFTDYSFLSKLNSEKLTHLSIGGNNFPRQDLTRLGKHLTSFTSLESFGIPNSNFYIDSGLDHLPESLKQIWCDSKKEDAEQRANITELNISGKELEGELDLSDFVNLENLYCDKNQLTGLNISGCYKLKHLICNYNKLTNLNIKNCPEIVVLMCGINYLTNLDFLDHLNSDKLQGLFLIDNDFPRNDLTPFSRFVNLFILAIGNSDSKERAEKGIFNRFYGSLEPLQNMSKLEHLIIPNTDIDSGLEYLPNSVEKLFCQVHQEVSPDRRVKAIGQELRRFGEPKKDESYNGLDNLAHLLPIWKANRSLKLKIQELEQANDDSFQELIKSDKEYALAAHAIQKGYNSTTVNIMDFNYDNKELGKTINGGELDLTEFPNLEKIYICGLYLKSKLTKLTLANKVKLASLDCSYNEFQELEITDFTNLKKLVCHNNNLVSLSLTNCPNIIELDFENNSLTDLNFLIGSVPLINLEKLNLSGNKSISSLEPLKNLKNLKSLNISKTSLSPNLEHLENLTELDCSGNDLISLDLKKAINLVKIGCSNNQLTELDLSNCLKLVELNCNNNLLTNLDLTHNKELEDLNLAGNNFSEDLSFLTHLTKLESLKLGDGSFFGLIIKNKDIRNRFVGSLEYLKNMNNLRTLDISNTDLESGLEYLPDNLKKIICAYEKSDGCAKIAKQLKKYKIKDNLDSDEELEKLFKEFEKLLLTKTESDSEEEHSNEQSETKIQELDIQEWLDIEEVKMTPEQFLSEGNDAELRELFAEYKKQQTQVEIPPK